MSDYQASGIGVLSFTSRVITLTYKDLGMYNLELKKE